MLAKDKIKEYRKNLGMTGAQLAGIIGVSPGNYSRYEHGYVRTIPDDVLQKLAKVFGCTVNDLVGDDPAYRHLHTAQQRKKLSDEITPDDDKVILQWFHSMPHSVQAFIRDKAREDVKNAVD